MVHCIHVHVPASEHIFNVLTVLRQLAWRTFLAGPMQGNILNINLLYTNASVAALSDPVLKAEGITPDGRPSVIISYRYTHGTVWPDDTVDELREVRCCFLLCRP
jgi:hypothetical protein